jgi:hypothetical protein
MEHFFQHLGNAMNAPQVHGIPLLSRRTVAGNGARHQFHPSVDQVLLGLDHPHEPELAQRRCA